MERVLSSMIYKRLSDSSGHCRFSFQAHNSDINSLAVANAKEKNFIATCGRDRTIQIFQSNSENEWSLDLIQTLDDHAAAVSDVTFTGDGTTLLSISSDRSLLIRKYARDESEAVAFLTIRTITLRSTPVSLSLASSEADVVFVSSMDRQIYKFDFGSGRLLSSFKPIDPSMGDSVLMTSITIEKLTYGGEERHVLVGASSSDRALRIHDCNGGRLLFCEQGQTTVSCVKVFSATGDGESSEKSLISCGLDGTVFVWSVSPPKTGFDSPNRTETPFRQNSVPSSAPRKTLTKAEVAKFQRSLENDEDDIVPLRSPSPSRIRRKTSRLSMADSRRSSLAAIPNVNTPAVPNESPSIKTQDQAPGKFKPPMNSRRPSLDPRRRSRSAANLNDLNDSAEKLCQSLRVFRERLESSVSGKLSPDTAKALENELYLTSCSISEKTGNTVQEAGKFSSDSIEAFLSKMIDERLALRADPTTVQSNSSTQNRQDAHQLGHIQNPQESLVRIGEALAAT